MVNKNLYKLNLEIGRLYDLRSSNRIGLGKHIVHQWQYGVKWSHRKWVETMQTIAQILVRSLGDTYI